MQIAFALIAVFWWIAVWGLSDLLTENWSRKAKFQLYITMLVFVGIVILLFPALVNRL